MGPQAQLVKIRPCWSKSTLLTKSNPAVQSQNLLFKLKTCWSKLIPVGQSQTLLVRVNPCWSKSNIAGQSQTLLPHLQHHLAYPLLNVAGLIPNWHLCDAWQVNQRHRPAKRQTNMLQACHKQLKAVCTSRAVTTGACCRHCSSQEALSVNLIKHNKALLAAALLRNPRELRRNSQHIG
jgi:hypothetical protein